MKGHNDKLEVVLPTLKPTLNPTFEFWSKPETEAEAETMIGTTVNRQAEPTSAPAPPLQSEE